MKPVANSKLFPDNRIKKHNLFFSKSAALFICCVLFSVSGFAQLLTPVSDVKKFEEHKKYYMEIYPQLFTSATITGIEPLDKKHTMIHYTEGLNHFETVVNSDRENMLLIATCRQIPEDSLPKVVLDAAKKSPYGKSEMGMVYEVSTPYSSRFYRVDFIENKEGKEHLHSLFLDHTGNKMQAPY